MSAQSLLARSWKSASVGADYLKTDEDIAAYLEAVMEDGDPALITAAGSLQPWGTWRTHAI